MGIGSALEGDWFDELFTDLFGKEGYEKMKSNSERRVGRRWVDWQDATPSDMSIEDIDLTMGANVPEGN